LSFIGSFPGNCVGETSQLESVVAATTASAQEFDHTFALGNWTFLEIAATGETASALGDRASATSVASTEPVMGNGKASAGEVGTDRFHREQTARVEAGMAGGLHDSGR
jgi:hypothetical protein